MVQKKTERVYVRVDPDWLKRARGVADRLGIDLSSYIILSVSERMRKDEREESKNRKK